MTIAKLILQDEVNCRFDGLDMGTRKRMMKELEYFDHKAIHTEAYKYGRWDGKKTFFKQGGGTYIHLLNRVLPIAIERGFEIQLDDRRNPLNREIKLEKIGNDYLSDVLWPDGHRFEGQPIELLDHQVRTINLCMENPQCVQQVSTGAGKTITSAALARLVETNAAQIGGRTITIVPNTDLVLQTEADFKNVGLDVGVFYAKRKEVHCQHVICTWQSLNVLDEKSKGGGRAKRGQLDLDEIEIHTFLSDVAAVIVDEAHSAKGEVLKNLLDGPFAHVPLRWGLTGTVPKDEFDSLNLLGCIGPLVGEVTAKELQDLGFLANCEIKIMQMLEVVNFNNWQEELKYLTSDPTRLAWLGEFITDISKTGNTLILVDRISAGEELARSIPNAEFVHGGTSTKKRKEQYSEINEADGKIVIATYGVAAVGLNIPRIFNMVLIEPGKSHIRTIQSVGRGLRKAKDKDSVMIYDITSTCKYSKRHLTQRKKHYKEAQYKFKVHKVDYLNINS